MLLVSDCDVTALGVFHDTTRGQPCTLPVQAPSRSLRPQIDVYKGAYLFVSHL